MQILQIVAPDVAKAKFFRFYLFVVVKLRLRFCLAPRAEPPRSRKKQVLVLYKERQAKGSLPHWQTLQGRAGDKPAIGAGG